MITTTGRNDKIWDHYYLEEADAAFLYRALAVAETDPKRKDLFERLAAVEDRHVEHWGQLIAEDGRTAPSHQPGWRARMLAWVARRLGPSAVLPWILAEEGREVAAYLRLAKKSDHPALRDTAATIAIESAEHARELAHLVGRPVEPWHTAAAGGYVRSIVYGFNDGLTANFGLVAGVIGASVAPHIVIITGIAGAMADALSMGASGYLAAKSEAEVHAHEIEMEREEIRLMPEIEREELALIYEAKGFPIELARSTADALMSDPEQALKTKVREELGIGDPGVSPLRDGLITGIATAVGAFIPILPFLLASAGVAIWISLTISMLAHFGVGAARSMFTGRSLWASGRDMFLVGFGVAAVGYVLGIVIEKTF
jgi:vacuolar iron transporter family protein